MNQKQKAVMWITALMLFVIVGCANSPYSVLHMSQEQRRQVSDEVLCNAYSFRGYWLGREQPEIVAEVIRRGLDCSVEGQARKILEENPEYTKTTKKSFGTGFVVSSEGHIVTVCHVIKDAKAVRVHFRKESFISAKVLHSDPMNDLAILKIEKPTPIFLQIAPMRSVKTGDRVFTMGFPVRSVLGKEAKYTEGVVSSFWY